MQSELKSLSKIFSESILRIPDYQRGYSWQQKHLNDFWNDVEQLPAGKSHYTGVLTLEPVNESDYSKWEDDLWIIKSKRYSPYYVVDGQQRLTTIVVLLQAILESISEEAELNYTTKSEIRKKYIFESRDQGISRSCIFGYEKDNPSYEFLKRSVYREQSENHSAPEDTIYTANLGRAKEYFLGQLRGKGLQEIELIYTKVTQNLQFNIFYIEPELDVFVTFETMNNRGKPLSQLELLKNRLIYLASKFDDDDGERDRLRKTINESWKTIYHYLGKDPRHILDDDIFLRTHFLSYFGPRFPKVDPDDPDNSNYAIYKYVRRDDQYKRFLLEEVFTAKRVGCEKDTLTLAEINDYALDIKSSVEIYFHLFKVSGSRFADEVKVCIDQLSRVASYDAMLLTLVAMQTVSDAQEQYSLLSTLERFSFLSKIRPYSFREAELDQLAIKLKAGKLTPAEVMRKLESDCTRFVLSPDFAESIRAIGKGDGYYGWGYIRYFLYEYEQFLRGKSKAGRLTLQWDTASVDEYEGDFKSIEHIYPQKAVDPYWKEKFKEYSVPERNFLRNSVGNLLPVSGPKNSSLSNKSFTMKCGSAENQVGYRYGCLSEVQVSFQTQWGASQILGRGLDLLDFMENRWRIDLGNDEKKVDLLGLRFVLSKEGVDLSAVRKAYKSSFPQKVARDA